MMFKNLFSRCLSMNDNGIISRKLEELEIFFKVEDGKESDWLIDEDHPDSHALSNILGHNGHSDSPGSKTRKGTIKSFLDGLQQGDLTEKFITGWGPGGQKINKTSSAVYLL